MEEFVFTAVVRGSVSTSDKRPACPGHGVTSFHTARETLALQSSLAIPTTAGSRGPLAFRFKDQPYRYRRHGPYVPSMSR